MGKDDAALSEIAQTGTPSPQNLGLKISWWNSISE